MDFDYSGCRNAEDQQLMQDWIAVWSDIFTSAYANFHASKPYLIAYDYFGKWHTFEISWFTHLKYTPRTH